MSPPDLRRREFSATEYEEALEQSGGFGRFQIRVFILVSLFETPVAWAMVLPVFTGASSEWICPVNGTAGNETVPQNSSQCEICPGMQYTADFTSIKTEWDLVCGRDYIPDLITSLQMLGVLIGALVTGQLADMYGRRRMLFLAYLWLLVSWLTSAFSSSWQMYTALRMLVGAGIGGVMVVNFVLPLEFVTPRWRTFCGCIGFWAVGVMTLGLWGYFIRDWRHVTIATAVTGIPLLLFWWWVPESPRWLLSKGRIDEAKTILRNMATTNKKSLPQLGSLYTFSEKEQIVRQERKKYSYWHLCSSWQLAKNTLILMFGWFVSSSVYYGFILNVKNLAGDRYLNLFLSGLMELPAVIFVVLVNNRLGRRRTTCLLMMTAAVSCGVILVFAALKKLELWSSAVTTFAMLGKFGISGGWAAVQVFSAETFPTVVRNIGVGSCSMSARIGGIVAPQFVFLSKISDSIPYIIFGGTALTCAILVLALPETNKVPLPDQLEDGKSNGHVTTSANEDHALEDIPLNHET